jgi:proteasome lid subunit RPN8/RPN11
MWHGMVRRAQQLLADLRGQWPKTASTHRPSPGQPAASGAISYAPLKRVVLTDGVGRTLFEEYAQHRKRERGEEEIGWMLLGLRHTSEAVVLATLPAGAERDASVSHVRFNTEAQALASRIIRQADRRLTTLGVVHTHPGSLRHPSNGDLRGDGQWVAQLRGQEGVFGIGTADGTEDNGAMFSYQPRPHVQCLGGLRFSWYGLRHGDQVYRSLPVELTIGPDLARPLHRSWPLIEAHGQRLDRLCRQQVGVHFEVSSEDETPGLCLSIPLAEQGTAIRVLLGPEMIRYLVVRKGEVLEVDLDETGVDRGVYLLLAELASQV